jgi:hypothetical protein
MATAVVAMACGLGAGARADVWDDGPTNDDTSEGTVNELLHGSDQVHDLAGRAGNTVADVDWFRLQVPLNTAYEVIVDEFAGGIGGPGSAPIVELVQFFSGGFGLVLATPVTDFGSARRIARSDAGGTPGETAYYVRVRGAACGAGCTSAARYRIRMVDNTLRLARFNNTNGQSTVLVLQNPTNTTQVAVGYAFGAAGEPVGTVAIVLAPNAVVATDLSTAAGGQLANESGGMQLLSAAPYGTLTGKAVQLDPATGFVFETAVEYRKR